MAIGEMLRDADRDGSFRGTYWQDSPGASWVFTRTTPNRVGEDLNYWDHLSDSGCPDGAHQPRLNLPCRAVTDHDREFAASRSRHPGGVQVVLCDGAVRFVNDSIDLDVWRAVGAIESGDPLELP